VVTHAATFASGQCARLILAQAESGETLPPPTKAAAQMALIGIALVGLLFVVMILLGGHWVRRQGTHRRGPVVPPDRAPIVPKKLESEPQRHDEHDVREGQDNGQD
jgi:hypothetical protein